MCFLILAGGNGERLWPLSNKETPKQLVSFLGGQTLLDQTIDRIKNLRTQEQTIWVMTTSDQYDRVNKSVGSKVDKILVEPESRNTGSAITYAAHEIEKESHDSVMVVLPSDHFIPDVKNFCSVILQAIDNASTHESIAILGCKPAYPATGYGYIHTYHNGTDLWHTVKKFHEKPDSIHAQEYCSRDDMFWNMGIFIARTSVLIREVSYCAPKLLSSVKRYISKEKNYSEIENISFDYAVLEKSFNIIMFLFNYEWHDVGNLASFVNIKARYESNSSCVLSHESEGNLISSKKKLIVCLGVNNLCIVETDDVLVISHREQTESIKRVRTKIKEQYESLL